MPTQPPASQQPTSPGVGRSCQCWHRPKPLRSKTRWLFSRELRQGSLHIMRFNHSLPLMPDVTSLVSQSLPRSHEEGQGKKMAVGSLHPHEEPGVVGCVRHNSPLTSFWGAWRSSNSSPGAANLPGGRVGKPAPNNRPYVTVTTWVLPRPIQWCWRAGVGKSQLVVKKH